MNAITSFIFSAIPLLSIAGFSVSLNRKFGVSPYIAPLAVISGIATLLYISDFILLMRLISLCLLVIGCLLLTGPLRDACRGLSSRHKGLILVLVLGVLFLYDLNAEAAFTNWDEFSHWGTIVKLISAEHTFHLKARGISYYFQDYPPGMALVSYYFLRLGPYSEPTVFFSYSMVLLACALPLAGAGLRVSYVRGFLASLIAFYLINRLGQGWSSALIDQIVGMIFGGALCALWISRDTSWKNTLALVPILCFLVLSKQAGGSLFLIVAGLVLLDRLYCWKFIVNSNLSVSDAANIAALFAVPYLIGASWKRYVLNEDLKRSFPDASLTKGVSRLVTDCCSSDRELTALGNFLSGLSHGKIDAKIPAGNFLDTLYHALLNSDSPIVALTSGHFGAVCLLVVLITLGACLHHRPSRERALLWGAVLITGGAAYMISLLIYYMYFFSDYEGRTVISMDRYLHTYELALAMFAATVLLSGPIVRGSRFMAERILVAVAGLAYFFHHNPNANSYLITGADRIAPVRQEIRDKVKPFIAATKKNANVYVIWQGTEGFELWMTNYELRPKNTNFQCFSLGPSQYNGDMYSCNLSAPALLQEFLRYDYVFVGKGLDGLEKTYPDIFKPTQDPTGFFSVHKDTNGRISLAPMKFSNN
ncbi:hypothetical protein [Herbaspirillum robiniae]|uniref:hypothetical protein n=1 Tax=Herbaspirillum robiniae TaxID=2014887 RepID=UPI003D785EC7